MKVRNVARWVLWFGMVVLVTVVLVPIRSEADQSYIPLAYLLIVLGGSLGAGHRLGFALATVSFLVMDYYLQQPYNRVLTFGRPADFVTLAAFYAVAGVASRLLESARHERDLALRRAEEVTALSRERERLIAEVEHVAALREAERLKDFVLTSVSHDLRTPLTTIKALAQEEQRTGTSRGAEIEDQVDRLSRMVTDLLDLSRLRSGTFRVEAELNAAEDVIGAAIRQVEGILNGRKVTALIDSGAPALYGHFDFLLTLRILGNLIENALKVTAPGTAVEVSPSRDERGLIIAVADRGPGVPEAERERIFEPFYRPSGAQPDLGRAGLGLAIARALAQAQGGRIGARPRPGGGSVFVAIEAGVPSEQVHAIAARLVKLALWEQTDTGYRVHDYLEWQSPKTVQLDKREAAKVRQQRLRERRADQEAKAEEAAASRVTPVSHVTNALSSDARHTVGHAGVTRLEEEKEEEENMASGTPPARTSPASLAKRFPAQPNKSGNARGDLAYPEEFASFWALWPSGLATSSGTKADVYRLWRMIVVDDRVDVLRLHGAAKAYVTTASETGVEPHYVRGQKNFLAHAPEEPRAFWEGCEGDDAPALEVLRKRQAEILGRPKPEVLEAASMPDNRPEPGDMAFDPGQSHARAVWIGKKTLDDVPDEIKALPSWEAHWLPKIAKKLAEKPA